MLLERNIRNVARKEYKKPGSEPTAEKIEENTELEKGDKVTILSCINKNMIGKTGEIISGPSFYQGYEIKIDGERHSYYWLLKDQIKKLEE